MKEASNRWTGVLGALLFVLIVGMGLEVQAADQAREIMVKNYEASLVQDSTGSGVLTLYSANGEKRVRETASVSKLDKNGKDQMRLIRFLAPADVKGTGLLTKEHSGSDDDIWIYLPALRKVRRIISQEKSNSFMGSEFSYVDILDPDVDEYQHKLLGNESIDGVACFKVESVPANSKIKDEQGYSKKISWLRTDNYMAAKIDFFDKDGAFLKTLLAKEIREIDKTAHKWIAMRREMTNHKTKRKSDLIMKDIKVNTGVSGDIFTTNNLERGRP